MLFYLKEVKYQSFYVITNFLVTYILIYMFLDSLIIFVFIPKISIIQYFITNNYYEILITKLNVTFILTLYINVPIYLLYSLIYYSSIFYKFEYIQIKKISILIILYYIIFSLFNFIIIYPKIYELFYILDVKDFTFNIFTETSFISFGSFLRNFFYYNLFCILFFTIITYSLIKSTKYNFIRKIFYFILYSIFCLIDISNMMTYFLIFGSLILFFEINLSLVIFLKELNNTRNTKV